MVFTIPFFRNLMGRVTGGRTSLDQCISKDDISLCKHPSPLKKRGSEIALDEGIRTNQETTLISDSPFISEECIHQNNHSSEQKEDPTTQNNSFEVDQVDDSNFNDMNCIIPGSSILSVIAHKKNSTKIKRRKFKQTSLYTGPSFSLMRSFVRESFPINIENKESFSIMVGSRDTIPIPNLDEIKVSQTSESSKSLLIESAPIQSNQYSSSPIMISNECIAPSIQSHDEEVCVYENVLNALLFEMSVNVGGKENDLPKTSLDPHSFESVGDVNIRAVTSSSVAQVINSTTRIWKEKVNETERNAAYKMCISTVNRKSVRINGYIVTPRIASTRSSKETCLDNDKMSSVLKPRYSRPEHHLMSPCTQRTKSTLKRFRLERIAAPQSRKRHARSCHINTPV